MGFWDAVGKGLEKAAEFTQTAYAVDACLKVKPPGDLARLVEFQCTMSRQEFRRVKEAISARARVPGINGFEEAGPLLDRFEAASQAVEELAELPINDAEKELRYLSRRLGRRGFSDLGTYLDSLARHSVDESEARKFSDLSDCAHQVWRERS